MPTVRLELMDINGNVYSSSDCFFFSFEKESYTPYTSLNASFYFNTSVPNPKEVSFYIDEKRIHHGIIDSIDFCMEQVGKLIVKLKSKGFTSMLIQNQLEPGLKPNVSLNSLMDSFIPIPNVTHENNANTQNYIFVKENSNMWDSIANLSYKLLGTYPYIEGTNTVRISPKASPINVNLNNEDMLSYGIVNDYTKIISDYHMQDINGDYSVYNLSNPVAYGRNIVRHKHIDIDRQYLSSPQDALVYRIAHSMRGFFSYYGEYQGYNAEDLNDTLTIAGIITNAKINRLVINGNAKGISTKCYAYYDNFYNL